MTAEELRKSILQMAIQGKLVKQDPNDEPASVLLERIREEKTRLIKEGKIKGKMTDSVIYKGSDNSYYEKVGNKTVDIATELPFDIPDNWCWCRMDSIFKIVVGATPSTSVGEYWNNGNIPWLPSGCCQDCTVDLSYPKIKYITQKGYDSCSTTMMFPSTVLIALTGATAGKVGLLTINACANQSVVGISAFIGIDPKFLYYQLMARRGEILSDCIGSAQPHISKDYITKMFFALPPLAEQQRIVTRISELNPLLIDYDSLEAQERKLDESLPNELRKSILQYAIQGKLVPQNPSDEPASVLLERIRSEREKANGGKKSKAKTESYIFKNSDDNSYYENYEKIDDLLPFEIPDSWRWCRLGELIDFSKNKSVSASDIAPDAWVLDLEDIEKDSGKILVKKRKKDLIVKSDKHEFNVGNVLYSKLRPYLNKVVIADEQGYCTSEILAFDFGEIIAEYAQIYLMSPYFVDYAMSDAYGVKMPRVGSAQGNAAFMPIPPIKEQERIVLAVKEAINSIAALA